ncbi:MAG TPA: choice-of-anchor tandem repeat GloVer-containing protein [Verrucomicrobiae bacterium]|nr:choice-of-anchor tandem repeat GloVer-containing protein [Verrucomicrobiae bacterium]
MKKPFWIFGSSLWDSTATTKKKAGPSRYLLPGIVVSVVFVRFACQLAAQPIRILHTFTGSDGEYPASSLILLSNILYGTTSAGGALNYGAAFKVGIDGFGFTNFHDFSGISPSGWLVLSDKTLYGTSQGGGDYGYGAAFSLDTGGGGATNLHSFTAPVLNDFGANTNTDGIFPRAGLILSQNLLYGTASGGGLSAAGTVFRVGIGGGGFATLYTFSFGDGCTNTDGAIPFSGVALSGNVLYGTTYYGGSGGNGTIFAVNTEGSDFRVLYNFAPGGPDQFNDWPNAGGGNPHAELLVAGETLYGTAENGGSGAGGTIFKIKTDGSGFATLHNFNDTIEGIHPTGGLILSGSTLYGATRAALFAIETNGTGYVKLHTFSTSESGPNPNLLLSGNTLYGTTREGGASHAGTVFSFFIPARLTINRFGEEVVLAWPTNAGSFTLQTSTDLASTNWTTVSPAPVLSNGQNTVTNTVSGIQRFYRLVQ